MKNLPLNKQNAQNEIDFRIRSVIRDYWAAFGYCFERCMSACESAPEYYMPGLRPFEEEAAICKACEYYQDD